MPYKTSKYNIIAKAGNNGHLVYNMVKGSLIHIRDDHFNKCKFLIDDKYPIPKNPSLISSLSEVGCLVPKDFDELKNIEHKYKLNRKQDNLLVFSIIPTLDCNFQCKYCYQARRKSVINRNVLQNIELMIKKKLNKNRIRTVHIDWIGGEPLLEIDKILFLQNRIRKICSDFGAKLFSSISTNGYLLSGTILDNLFNTGIQRINITLAGNQKYHNLLRGHKHHSDSFQVVYNNLKKIDSRFTLMLNIDISRQNYLSIPPLLELIKTTSFQSNYAIVFNRIESFSANPCYELELSISEFIHIYLDLMHKVFSSGIPLANNSRFGINSYSYCGVQLNNNFIINWDGSIYKCCEFGKLHENPIGYIDSSGELNLYSKELEKWSFNPFYDEQCRSCSILPYCFGGCMQKRNCGKHFCPEEKEYLPEYLELYYLYLQQKDIYQNKT